MVTFNKIIRLAYSRDSSVLMTPLCGAVYSRESVKDMAIELQMEEVQVTMMINSSTATGGQHLDESDLACAVVSMIATTKRVASKDVRNMMITKIIKQYSARHKQYDATRFAIISKYALGGVPQGMDADTLIESFLSIQTTEVNLRTRALAIKQAESLVKMSTPTTSTHDLKKGTTLTDLTKMPRKEVPKRVIIKEVVRERPPAIINIEALPVDEEEKRDEVRDEEPGPSYE